MAISPYSLISVDEFKRYVPMQGVAKDDAIEDILNRVSDEIEDSLDRQIVTRTTADTATRLVEYHTLQTDCAPVETSTIHLLERPIISVFSVYEDVGWPKSYSSASLLTVSTDYYLQLQRGVIRRTWGGVPRAWSYDTRAIKVVYSAGYADTASVPQRIKGVALRYAALLWAETQRNQFGISGASDTLGNFTRFSVAKLDDDMMNVLADEQAGAFWRSGERDT